MKQMSKRHFKHWTDLPVVKNRVCLQNYLNTLEWVRNYLQTLSRTTH